MACLGALSFQEGSGSAAQGRVTTSKHGDRTSEAMRSMEMPSHGIALSRGEGAPPLASGGPVTSGLATAHGGLDLLLDLSRLNEPGVWLGG